MRISPVARPRRGGLAIVEAALLLSIFLLFLFAVFEYSRLLLLLHVSTNAARSGARHATVNVDKPVTFVTLDDSGIQSITNHIIGQMGGADTMIHNFNVTAFPCDTAQMYQNPPVLAPRSGSPPWNQASFTERIGVQITGEYRPILPGFVFFYSGGSSAVPITITAAAGSEG